MGKTYQETLDGIQGGYGASLIDQQRTFERLQRRCMSRVLTLVAANPNTLSKADVQVYERDVFSEEALAISGKVSFEDKIKALQENLDRFLPEMEREVPALERKFRSQLENAIAQKWIGRRSVARWMQRLATDNAYYYQKKVFIEDPEKFPKFLKNWEKVATERKKLLDNPLIKTLSGSNVKNLNIFLNEEDFLNRPFEERENLVAAVQAALSVKAQQMPQLHAKAKYMLEGAARNKALSWNKIGVWLDRIFKSGASCETIEAFIQGQGSTIGGKRMTLNRLIANWSEASTHFRTIEHKRQNKGTPRGFHFVTLEVFLNWRFEQRKAYLSEAENSFEQIKHQNEDVLKIRHELAAQDWDSAEDLLTHAMAKPMTLEQKTKLESLKKFLREHQKQEDRPPAGTIPETALELRKEMRALLAQIPSPMVPFYEEALRYGDYQTLWALTTIVFNRIWCYQHNFLDDQKERTLEKQAKDDTRKYIRQGHKRRGHEAVSVKEDTNTESAVRYQAGVKGALFQFVKKESAPTQMRQVHKQANIKDYWYWASLIPEGVPYADQLNVVQNIHPRMKKLARKMQDLGIGYYDNAFGNDGAATAVPAKRATRIPLPSMN